MTQDHLTHVDARGEARMVDVSAKEVTVRTATATGFVVTTEQVVALLRGEGVPKGDALAVARIAGIQAAKRTPDLVPLCHPVAIHGVTVDLEGTIRNGEEFSFDVQANGISGGNSNGYALTQSVTLPSDGIIITGALGAAQATVNSSNGRLAVGNAQSIGSNEFIRFDFVTGITVDNTAPISQSGFNFGTYNPVNYISQQVVQTQSGNPTTLV